MKKIWYFIQWQYRRLETWQKWWMFAMFLFGGSFSASPELRPYYLYPAMAIIMGFILKWAVYDGIKNAWAKYNEEQEKIIDILKDTK